MNAGRLDRRLTIQARTLTKDAQGGRVETWDESRRVWGALIPGGAGEPVMADAERAVVSTRFKIRHIAIDPAENRISYGGQIYEITGITEDGPRRTYLLLNCQTISALP